MRKRIKSVFGEYIWINPGCLENKKARLQGYAEFYGFTQADINENYRIALTEK
jgi:hypothetical protein